MSKVKIQSLLNFEKPRNPHALRSLLGLADYFRGFIPNHSRYDRPQGQKELTTCVDSK